MALAKANHRMDVYDLLTEEQRTTFDEMKGRMGNRMGVGMRNDEAQKNDG